MAEKILENHKIVTTEHEMRIDGHYLSEKKQRSLVEPHDKTEATTIMVHVRTIDDRCYKVTVAEKQGSPPERTTETEMNEEEIELFLQDSTGTNYVWIPRNEQVTINQMQ